MPGRHWPAFAGAALALLTFLFFTQYDGFEPRGENLLDNADFSDGLGGWQWSGSPNSVRAIAGQAADDAPAYVEISNEEPSHSVHLWQVIAEPGRFGFVRVELDLQLEGVMSGQKREHKARIVLTSFDGAGNGLWHHPHLFLVQDGSHGWKHYRAWFPVGRDVHEMRLIAQLYHATGLMRLRGLTLSGAAAQPDRLALQGLLMALWVGLGLVLARNLVRAGPGRRAGVIASVLAAVFLIGSLSPKQLQLSAENEIVSLYSSKKDISGDKEVASGTENSGAQEKRSKADARFATRVPQPPDFELLRPGKFAHLILFALFGAALVLRRPRAAAGLLLASLLLAAVCGEVLQFFAHGRTPALHDIAINTLGAFAGGSVILLASWLGFRRAGAPRR